LLQAASAGETVAEPALPAAAQVIIATTIADLMVGRIMLHSWRGWNSRSSNYLRLDKSTNEKIRRCHQFSSPPRHDSISQAHNARMSSRFSSSLRISSV